MLITEKSSAFCFGILRSPAYCRKDSTLPRPQRAAVIGVSHWHSIYDVAYLKILKELKVDIVGVSDEDASVAQDRAAKFDSTPYTDYRSMIEKTKPEFVIALGKHIEMPVIFRFMVDTRIPFVMEKPWGTDLATVESLAELAESKNVWAGAPIGSRYRYWAQEARRLMAAQEFGTVCRIIQRTIRPSMQRYLEWDSPWMLKRRETGGGALINLGSHHLDTLRFITGEELSVVAAVISNAVHHSEVEDYAMVTMRTPSGTIVILEVGYTYPSWPDNKTDSESTVLGEKMLLRAEGEGLRIIGPNGRDEKIRTPQGYGNGHQRVISECLDRIANGQPPPVTTRDAVKMMSLVQDAYLMAGRI
jgi:predicted dehydrogenase